MPRTIRAEVLGFCPGVRRAVALVEQTIESDGEVATLGPIIHNSRVVERLAERGVSVAGKDEIHWAETVISRSHGIPRGLQEKLRREVDSFIDGTCAKVTRIHREAARAERDGSILVVVGEPEHAEVKGIVSHCSHSFVVSTPEEVYSLPVSGDITVVAQTTVGRPVFTAVVEKILKSFPNARIVDSICPETDRRHKALRTLARLVDAIIVVGGRTSSNTGRLFVEAVETGVPSWLVEGSSELPDDLKNYECIGIAAGTSTPEWIIDEVEDAIQKERL